MGFTCAYNHAVMFLQRLDLTREVDRAIATRIFLQTPAYETATFHRLPTAETGDQLAERFPKACPMEERLSFVAKLHDLPLALVQVARHYPSAERALLMLVLVSQENQRHHFGCELMERLSMQARRWAGVTTWELCVLETNQAGIAFWRHCGFRRVGSGEASSAAFHGRLIRMERAIKGRPACQTGRIQDDADALLTNRLVARLS